VILLDTHVLVWLSTADARLGRKMIRTIDRSLPQEGVFVSAISFWEVGMLVAKGRVRVDPTALRADSLKIGIQEIGVDGNIAIAAGALGALHGDPADRIIVATALEAEARLASADEALLAWRGGLKTCDARI